jgi:hypothetical protein
MAFVLAAALTAFAQGRSGGHAAPPQAPPAGAGQSGMGSPMYSPSARPADPGKPANVPSSSSQGQTKSSTQQTLSESQLNSGAFRMLQDKTGKTSEELQQMYAASGAKNFGQFTSAVIVARNLNLETTAVLDGLQTKTLGQTLKDMGISEDAASAEIGKAKKEAKAANKKKSS